jgi:hypothetical protein
MVRCLFLAVMVVVLAACAPPKQRTASPPASGKRPVDPATGYRFHSPAEIVQLMARSKISYRVVPADTGDVTRLDRLAGAPQPHDPMLVRVSTPGGKVDLTVAPLTDEVEQLFEKAAEAMERRSYQEASDLYRKATEVQPDHFMCWTNLGSTLFLLGRHDEAIAALQRAIGLNEVGYQAHWFQADTYFLGKREPQRALVSITRAFLLAKNNPRLRIPLRSILGANGLRVRDDRLAFPFAIRRVNARECEIRIRPDEPSWLALANCLAVWQMEPSLLAVEQRIRHEGHFNSAKYRECLVHAVAGVAVDAKQGKRITAQQRLLRRALEQDGFLDEMVLWEIAATRYPVVMLLVPPDVRDRVEQYITRFVYEPDPAAGGPPPKSI